MKAWIGVGGFVLLSPALFAQWPLHATAGEPRTADGKVNRNAPAPKAADGHPDLSGVWDRGTVPATATQSTVPQPPVQQSTVQTGGFGSTPPPGPRPFQDLPSLFPDGLPLQPWAAELRKERYSENSKGHPDAHCLPLHPVQLHSHPQPRKIIQTPGEVVIVYEANDGLRQIFTDGRPLPVDPEPWWFGYSVGKWDGDALVVDTIGFRDMMWIDEEGTPITTSGRIHERFRRVNYYYCVIKNKTDVECFCGTTFCAKPTGKALCGIHRWLGESRRAR